MIEVALPGESVLRLETLLCDFNGTLAVDGVLPAAVVDRLERLSRSLRVVVATADTFGTVGEALAHTGAEVRTLAPTFGAAQKEKILEQLGADTAVAVGNGVNDHLMVGRAALGIGVLGREGAAWETLRRARIVVTDPVDALDLLLEPRRLIATLRA